MAAADTEHYVLVSSDGQSFRVSPSVVRIFRALDTLIEHFSGDSEEPIPLPNLTGRILGKVVTWANQYVHETPTKPQARELQTGPPVQPRPSPQPRVPQRGNQSHVPDTIIQLTPWEHQFITSNQDDLYELLLAANYLDVKRLLDIITASGAKLIRGKDPGDIRRTFHVADPDFSGNNRPNSLCKETSGSSAT